MLGRWQSGQMHQTVNLAGFALRRFESFPAQKFFSSMKKYLFAFLYVSLLLIGFEFTCRKFVPTEGYINRFAFNDNSSWRLRWVLNRKTGNNDPYKMDDYHPILGWRLNPNLRIDDYDGGKLFTSNSHGLRGQKEFTFERNEKPRIIVFGDSFTLGEQVSDEDTFVHVLGELLPNAEVLNMGVRGYGHDQMLLMFQEVGVLYKPNIVIFGFLGIDQDRNLVNFRSFSKPKFKLSWRGEMKLTNVPVPTPDEILKREENQFYFDDLLENVWARIYYKIGLARLEKNRLSAAIMDAFTKKAEEQGAQALFVYLPANHEINRSKKTKGERFFDKYARQREGHFLNVRPDFKKAFESGVDFGQGHWNLHGHEIVAHKINEYLIAKNLIQTEK